MSVISLSEASEFKNALYKKFSVKAHFHDCCGGQLFSFERVDEEMKEFIVKYFKDRGAAVVFSADGLTLRIE